MGARVGNADGRVKDARRRMTGALVPVPASAATWHEFVAIWPPRAHTGAIMATTAVIVEMLGGTRALRAKPTTPRHLRERVREGLPYASLDAVARRLQLDDEEIATLVGLPPRTLARRKAARRLRAEESDRLYRVSRIAALAEETLGSADKAARWLRAPNRALGHEAPLGCLDTDPGVRQVEDVLLRIAHGVHS